MAQTVVLAELEHVQRAEHHISVGHRLHEDEVEWAAVAYFYGAYHYVKAALLSDPIWSDAPSRMKIHTDLTPQDRLVTRHKGRRGAGASREWGINELVLKLYPKIARAYEQLHQASISVRYHVGIDDTALTDLAGACAEIQDAYEEGRLQAVYR